MFGGQPINHWFNMFDLNLPAQNYIASAVVEAAPGHIISETEHASTYEGATATTFEGKSLDNPLDRRETNRLVPRLVYIRDRGGVVCAAAV